MSSEARLKAGLWVKAAIRASQSQGMTAVLIRKGDADAGAVLIKQNLMDGGFRVLTQTRDHDGRPAWMPGTGAQPVEESAADAYIARQVGRDTDLWVLEIEDRQGRLPFPATILP